MSSEAEFAVEPLHRQLSAIASRVEGAFEPTIWKRATGYQELMVITGFATIEAQQIHEKEFLGSEASDTTYGLFQGTPNIDRFTIEIFEGCGPSQAPIDGYATFYTHQSDIGHSADGLEQTVYSIETLKLIDGFLGAVAGRSIIVPGRIDSLIFWANREAVEQSIPIRVDTNLRMYRKMV